jgi:hypothetical protein
MNFNDLLTGFIRLHILHHAAEHEIYGKRLRSGIHRRGDEALKCGAGGADEH